jgi:hypothetical protein
MGVDDTGAVPRENPPVRAKQPWSVPTLRVLDANRLTQGGELADPGDTDFESAS